MSVGARFTTRVSCQPAVCAADRFLAHPMHLPMRSAPISPAGAPIILTPRLPGALGAHFAAMSAGNINGCMPPLVSPPRDAASIVLSPYEAAYAPYTLSNAPTIFEYPRVDPASLTAGTLSSMCCFFLNCLYFARIYGSSIDFRMSHFCPHWLA